jgi:hypothetical protein
MSKVHPAATGIVAPMEEILPGLWHWTTPHPNLGGVRVSSYWLDDDGVLIDPLVPPDEGLDWFAARPVPPQAIVLANRHHYRDSGEFHTRFGCGVHVPANGLHAFTQGEPVSGYGYGEELPGGLLTVEVGALSPDDSGLYSESSRAFWLADTIVRGAGADAQIGWVVDQLMDDPPTTKRELLSAFQHILDGFEFDHLLLAHGLPLVGDGRSQLEQLVQAGGRTSFDAFP